MGGIYLRQYCSPAPDRDCGPGTTLSDDYASAGNISLFQQLAQRSWPDNALAAGLIARTPGRNGNYSAGATDEGALLEQPGIQNQGLPGHDYSGHCQGPQQGTRYGLFALSSRLRRKRTKTTIPRRNFFAHLVKRLSPAYCPVSRLFYCKPGFIDTV